MGNFTENLWVLSGVGNKICEVSAASLHAFSLGSPLPRNISGPLDSRIVVLGGQSAGPWSLQEHDLAQCTRFVSFPTTTQPLFYWCTLIHTCLISELWYRGQDRLPVHWPLWPRVKRCVHHMLGQSVFSTFKPTYCSEYTIFHRGWLMSAQVTTQLLIFHWKQDLKTEEIIFYINTHITPRNQAPCVCLSSVLLCVL